MYWFYLNKEKLVNLLKIRYFVPRNGQPFEGLFNNESYVFVSFLGKFGALRKNGRADLIEDGYWTEELVNKTLEKKFWIEITSRQACKIGFEIAPGQLK